MDVGKEREQERKLTPLSGLQKSGGFMMARRFRFPKES